MTTPTATGDVRRDRFGVRLGRLRTVAPAAAVIVAQLIVFPMPGGAWLQGVVLGLLNALVALGLTLVWRANRILNFAQADMGTFPAALGVGFILLSGASYFVGLAVGLAAAIAVGVLVELLVIRRFWRSPRLILTVATIGLSQLLIVAALLVPRLWGKTLLVSGNQSQASSYGFPWHLTYRVGEQVFHADDIVAAVVALICLAAVALLLRRSAVGSAIRATADRADRAAMLGIPVRRIETAVWVIASVLSFFGVFLQGAILGFPLNATVGITALVTALAALALGGFDDVVAITVSAVAIGVLDKGVAWNNTTRPQLVYGVLAIVVAVGLLARRVRQRRQDLDATSSWQTSVEPRAVPRELRWRPEVVAGRWVLGVAALAVAASLPLWLSPSSEFKAATVAAFALVALSIVVLTGWAGEVTLGQMGFAAAGAAIGAVATSTWGLDLSLALLVAGVFGAAIAVVVGVPALRFRGLLGAVTTLAFALAATGYLFDPNQFHWIPTTRVGRPALFGVWHLDSQGAMYELCLGVLVLAIVAVVGISRSHSGRALRAVRDNGRAAQSYGVRAPLAKLTAFAISGFLAAVAGCLLVHIDQSFDTTVFAPQESLNIFTAAVVGGVGSPIGALLGALVLNASRWLLSGTWQLLPSAIGVLVVLMILPGGIGQLIFELRDRVLRAIAARHGIRVPSLVADTREADEAGEPPSGPTGPEETLPGISPAGSGPAAADGTPQLELSGVEVAYDGVQVLFGVDFVVHPGEIVALLGTNGAGKSTLLRAVGGIAPTTGGKIRLAGDDITGRRPERIARQGIAQMPGGDGVFPSLTVEENLRIAGWLQRGDREQLRDRIDEVYDQFDMLARRRQEPAANLSGGQQQMLALGMALLSRPRLLLIDELSLGLAPTIVQGLLGVVAGLRDQGTTIVVVEQSVDLALGLADRAYFMEKGEVRFSGSAAGLRQRDDLVRSVYLSGAESALAAKAQARPTRTAVAARHQPDEGDRSGAGVGADGHAAALAAEGLSVHFGGVAAVHDVALHVAPEEILGVIGPNGAGKTTVFDLLCGFTRADRGHVELGGVDISSQPPSSRARRGLGRSFQDSRLFSGLTTEQTIAVALSRWVQVRDPLSASFRLPARQENEAAIERRVDELIGLVGIESFRTKFVSELSTGSRRLVDLACALAHEPSVILLDEPSSGIAQREVESLVPLLRRIRDDLGAALVVVEHDMPLITSVADRLVALDQGEVVTTGTPDDVLAHPRVVAAYLGTNDSATSGGPAGAPGDGEGAIPR